MPAIVCTLLAAVVLFFALGTSITSLYKMAMQGKIIWDRMDALVPAFLWALLFALLR